MPLPTDREKRLETGRRAQPDALEQITFLLSRAQEERNAAALAGDIDARETHIMLAERYADQAWSLNEAVDDLPAIPSNLWPIKGE